MKKLLAIIITVSLTTFSSLSAAVTDQEVQEAIDSYIYLNGPLEDDEMFIYDENYVEPLQVVKKKPAIRLPIKYLEFRNENKFCSNMAGFIKHPHKRKQVIDSCLSQLRYEVETADIFVHNQWKQGYVFENYRKGQFCSDLSYELPQHLSINSFMNSCHRYFGRLPHYYNQDFY